MAFIQTRLSPMVEAGFSAVSLHSTSVVSLRSGRESRNADWAIARRRYTARYGQWTRAMREELMGAIYGANGRLHSFLFRDWNDYHVSGQSLGTAPSGSAPVQLVRTYRFGATTVTRPIYHPVASTLTLTQGVDAKPGTVDPVTGLFVPSTPWTEGQPLAASFQFDVRVRFDRDDIEIVLPHREIAEVICDLIEVLPEPTS